MLGVGSAFRHAYCGLSAANHRWNSGQARPIWGDGLAEQSLSTLWYRCTWDNVSEDELAFLIPSLASEDWKGTQARAIGPRFYLRRALGARLHWAVQMLSSTMCGSTNVSEQVRDIIARSGTITALPFHQIWTEGRATFPELYGESPVLRSLVEPVREKRGSEINANCDVWMFELTVLACLDRILRDSLTETDARDQTNNCFGLPEAVIATIYASFNGAYIYRNFVIFHELLMIAAWLGYLVRGRPALMPNFIAEYIIAQLGCAPVNSNSESARCSLVLNIHADFTIGLERLLRIARRVTASGNPIMVRPRHRAQNPVDSSHLCNETLSARIAKRLNFQHF